MAEFSFTSSDGKPFSIKGPDGLTREQAEAIFKKQDSTGALVGFKPGDSLSAASQSADGFAAAQGALQQAQGGITGALGSVGSVAPLGLISRALGAAGGAGGGSLAATAAGLTAAVGPAVSAASGALSSIPGAAGAGNPLATAAVIQGSTAISVIQTINKTIGGFPITSPINIADFTKVASGIGGGSAVGAIGPMGIPEVNGVLAQAKNLIGQSSGAISNSKGVGSFGFDVKQLETAGYVKPGTSALMASAGSLLSSVVKSPTAWTGKDGIKSVTDLLGNPGKQSLIQQDLMTKGVAGLGAVGIPVQNLSSQGIAGMALNAAKSLPNAEAFAKGLPIPGDATGATQAAFSSAVRDGAFAVNLVNTKIPTAFKQQDIPVPKSDTVNRATLDAASSRVVGDPKVPTPSYTAKSATGTASDYISQVTAYFNGYLDPTIQKFEGLNSKFAALENQQTITQAQYDALNAERDAIRNNYNINGLPKVTALIDLYNSLPTSEQATIKGTEYSVNVITAKVQEAAAFSASQKERLNALSLKIEGRGEGE
jgi:hypothetical protein